MSPAPKKKAAKPQKVANTFQSFRILGKKAQGLLLKAKSYRGNAPNMQRVPRPQEPQPESIVMHLSTRSVARGAFVILGITLGAWLLWHLRDKILLLALAAFLAVVIDPGVNMLQKMRIPRGVAVLLHYLVALVLVMFLLVSFIPIIAQQIQQIAIFMSSTVDGFLADPRISLPLLSEDVNIRLTIFVQNTLRDLSINEFADALQQLSRNLSSAAQGSVRFAAQVAGSLLSFILNLILVLVMAFFMQMEKEKITRWVRGFFPDRYLSYVNAKSDAIHNKIGQWARGEALLMLSIFLLTLLALIILRMPYALTLAVLAGFCEFIPAVGPLIAAVPAVFIALSHEGLIWGLIIAGVYYVIQWCENNLLVPLIMKRAVGLSPIAIIFAMLVGVSFPDTIHPVLGVMVAIPTATILALFLEDWNSDRRHV